MGEVIAFKKHQVVLSPKGNSLCRSGLHKWILQEQQKFDVKQGKLVTVYRCKHCLEVKMVAI